MSRVIIAGVDEAGRGPLAGPVTAAAVILPDHSIAGLADSKQLSAAKRERLYGVIQEQALAWAIARAEVEEIDRINILQASLLAMQRAVMQLQRSPHRVLVDGNKAPDLAMEVICIVKGDQTEPAISAASILAKVSRDREMMQWHARYPEYGFDCHKGYPTQAHMEALRRHGVTPIHRRSFGPVKRLLHRETP